MPTTASGRREEVDVFVPGRVCLFGEHSDWAGCYRRINSKVPPGNVIISGTNQGIFARKQCRDEKFQKFL
ncbi:GHMP kinase [Diplonema papillatum]|nr:GHMP kinase [Diplonema papillatum]